MLDRSQEGYPGTFRGGLAMPKFVGQSSLLSREREIRVELWHQHPCPDKLRASQLTIPV